MSKKTVATIIQSGNDYLLSLKKNQKRLYDVLLAQTRTIEADQECRTSETGHGRREERTVSIWAVPQQVGLDPAWQSIRTIIRVDRLRSTKKRPEGESTTQYYISSCSSLEASCFGAMIRSHWGIENRLHWVKDVIFNEDGNRIRGKNAPENLSMLKNIAMNLYRHHGYDSMKHAIIRFSNKIDQLIQFLL